MLTLITLSVWPGYKAGAQAPSCEFSVLTNGTGIASASLESTGGSTGCPNVIDWGDGCTNNNTNTWVQHRYASCGTFTITHTVRWNSCAESAACTRVVTVNFAAARIVQSRSVEGSSCGTVEKLRATFTVPDGCYAANESVSISGTFPNAQFDVVGGDYSVSGNSVSKVVTAAQINAGATIELHLRPKHCGSTAPGTVSLSATAASMMLSTPDFLCGSPLSGSVTVPLNWTVTPKPACLSISKVALNPNAAPGENLQYRVTLTNTGTGPAEGVPVRDLFPSSLTPVTLPSGASVTGNTATWTEALVPAGGSKQYDLVFSTPQICPATFVNCVEASACGSTVGPACATAILGTGNMPVVQVSGNMYVSNGGTGLPVPPGLPSTGGIVPFVVEFAPFSTLSINETYIFPQGCIFLMREGAEIIVKADRQLTLDNNTRMASCDKMWKGIRVENNGALWMAKTYVSDAQYAVHIQQNATGLRLTENYFTDNQVGLYMPAGVSHKLDYHFIYFNTWQGTKPLKAAYAGMGSVHPLNAWSYAGMLMFNLSSGLTVGGNNNSFSGLFEGMVYGIRATNCSDITVYGNQFRNLNSSTYAKDPLTYGIFAVNGNALKPTIKVTGFGKTNPKLTFDNCQVGVYTAACHLDKVEQCNMGNMFIGVRAVDGRGCRLNIQQNKIAS